MSSRIQGMMHKVWSIPWRMGRLKSSDCFSLHSTGIPAYEMRHVSVESSFIGVL